MKTGLFVVAFFRIYPQGLTVYNVGDINRRQEHKTTNRRRSGTRENPTKSGNVKTAGKTRKAVDLIGVRSDRNIIKNPLSAPSAVFLKNVFLRLLRLL